MRSRIAAILLVFVGVGGGVAVETQSLQDKYFDSNGIRIRYVEAGTGTPIVLIHAYTRFLESNWINHGVFATLAKNYRVIAYDLPGHGKSGKASSHRPIATSPAIPFV